MEFDFTANNPLGIEVVEKEGTYYVRGLIEGNYELTVTATSTDGNNTVLDTRVEVIVLEKRKVDKIILVSPVEAALVGRPVELSVFMEDQYGETILPEEAISWKIEGVGEMTDLVYTSMEIGESVISALIGEVESETVQINCVGYNYNIALNKDIEAIGEVESDPARFANDGNEGTRWVYNPGNNSGDYPREYDAWITVDLGDTYDINLIEILWEGACAADYEIFYSLDNEDFGEAMYSMTDVVGMQGDVFHQFYDNPAEARYVKLLSSKAATMYGISLWEIKIFGSKELVIEGEGNHLVLSGTWNEEVFKGIDNEEITSYDMTQVIGLTAKPITQNLNCLIFVEAGSLIAGEDNVIAGDNAKKVVLKDGYTYNNSIKEFNADEVIYTRDFTGMNGWASLYLPFPANIEDYEVEYFTSYNAGESSIYFAKSTVIEANIPYIIKVDEYTGIINFESTGTTVLPLSSDTKFATPEGSDFTFKGTFETMSGANTLILKADGSEFVIGGSASEIHPFRAYIEANNGSASVKSLSVVHDDGGATNVGEIIEQNDLRVIGGNGSMEIISTISQTVYVYSINGQLIGKVNLDAGYNKVDGLVQGIYMVNNQKVIIK